MNDVTEKLAEALEDAMGWNWLDDDVPENAVKQCEAALAAYYESRKGGGVSGALMRYTESNGMRPHLDGEWVLYEDARAAIEAAGCGVDVEAVRRCILSLKNDSYLGTDAEFRDFIADKLARAIGDSHE
jgi:hypothetical protein